MKLNTDDCFIIDLDGTLTLGGEILPGWIRFCEIYQDRIAIVSNNSTHSVEQIGARLNYQGFTISPNRIILAGEFSLCYLKANHGNARIFMVSNTEIQELAQKKYSLNIVKKGSDIVFICRDTTFSYKKLSKAAAEIFAGAALFAANPDFNHPGVNGLPIPETGSILKAVEVCAGKQASRILGKPEPYMFLEAINRFNWKTERTVVIGDNKETDIRGAKRLGLRSFFIGSGGEPGSQNLNEFLFSYT